MPYLPEALESIMHQTYTNLEILCINDGSSDDTPEVLERYAAQDKRIRVVHNETNLKLIATLNKGVGLARGEFIARMDADDVSSNQRITRLLNFLTSTKSDIVSCNTEFITTDSKLVKKNFLKCLSNDEILFASYFFTPIAHAPLVGKKISFKKFQYSNFENCLHTEDYELWTRMLQNDVKMSNIEEVHYSIRINSESVSHKFESIQVNNFVHCANQHQSKLLQREIAIDITAVAVNRINQPILRIVRQGLQLVDEITVLFIKRYPESAKSFKSIAAMQKMDIGIQLVKHGSIAVKIYGLYQVLQLVTLNLIVTNFRKYLKSKF
jgi:glycosyltransferase involved in cell wall biosynthesis